MSDETEVRYRAAAIAERLAADDEAPMRALFAEIDSPPPTMVWDPQPGRLAQEQLRFLLAHWQRLRGDRALPNLREIEPLGLRPALGWVSILEARDDLDFVYRVYGTATAERMGVEMTGRSLWAIPVAPLMRIYHVASYRAAQLRRRPLFTHHFTPTRRPVGDSARIILPLADDAATVARLLAGIVTGEARPESIVERMPRPL